MSVPIFDKLKVIDPHKHMPKDVRTAYFDHVRELGYAHNGLLDLWFVGEETASATGNIVDKWLQDNGVTDDIYIHCNW